MRYVIQTIHGAAPHLPEYERHEVFSGPVAVKRYLIELLDNPPHDLRSVTCWIERPGELPEVRAQHTF